MRLLNLVVICGYGNDLDSPLKPYLDGAVEFIEALPRNPSGKVLKRVLREQARP